MDSTIQKVIRVGAMSLLLTVKESNGGTIQLYLGGLYTYVVRCMLFIKPTDCVIPTSARLTVPNWQVRYSLEHGYSHGIHINTMIRIMANYIAEHYPIIHELDFREESQNTILSMDGKVPYADMMFLIKGYNWYEKTFRANIDEDIIYPSYKNTLSRFHEIKTVLTWDSVKPDIRGIPDMRTAYDDAHTWHDFFEQVYDSVGYDEFYAYVLEQAKYMFVYINTIYPSRHAYCIPISQPRVTYTIHPMTKTLRRKRYTRRAPTTLYFANRIL